MTVLSQLPWKRTRSEQTHLICESDGFRLRATLFKKTEDEVHLSPIIETDPLSPQDAVAAVIRDLDIEDANELQSVALITPCVITDIIELPIPADEKRDPDEMQELIRWEMDPLLAEHSTLWSMSAVLYGLGYIDDSKRESLVQYAGKSGETRYGEVALSMGLIDQEQVDIASQLLEKLTDLDEDLSAAWTPIGQGMDTGTSLWLATACSRQYKEEWVEAFASNGIELSALCPAMGMGLSGLRKHEGEHLLLDIEEKSALCQRVKDGIPQSSERVYAAGEEITAEEINSACSAIKTDSTKKVWFTTRSKPRADFLDKLVGQIGLDLEAIHYGEYPPIVTAIISTGLELAEAKKAFRFPIILIKPPPAPLYKHEFFKEAVLVALLFLGIIGSEIYFYTTTGELIATEAETREKLMVAEETRDKIDEQKLTAEELQGELNKLQEETVKAEQGLQLLQETIPARNNLISNFMENLAKSVTPYVIVESISESNDLSLSVDGWSYTEKDAQQFIQRLAISMAPHGLVLRDESVLSQRGQDGSMGYALSLTLYPQKQAEPGL